VQPARNRTDCHIALAGRRLSARCRKQAGDTYRMNMAFRVEGVRGPDNGKDLSYAYEHAQRP
jgi:hypothetical protein